MPRATESKERQILMWFRTAPLSAALLLLGLVKGELREREGQKKVAPAPVVKRATRKPRRMAPPPPRRKKVKAKKSHHKKPVAPVAEVESFNPNDED